MASCAVLHLAGHLRNPSFNGNVKTRLEPLEPHSTGPSRQSCVTAALAAALPVGLLRSNSDMVVRARRDHGEPRMDVHFVPPPGAGLQSFRLLHTTARTLGPDRVRFKLSIGHPTDHTSYATPARILPRPRPRTSSIGPGETDILDYTNSLE